MPTINRDRDIVRHILRYCEQVDTAHKDFGHSKERFEEMERPFLQNPPHNHKKTSHF